MKKFISLLLSVLLLITVLPLTSFAETDYKVGDVIEFGSYPQSKVTDEAVLAKLQMQELNWVSYGYYYGDGDYDSMVQSDYMKYADFSLDGEKYRAVTFTQYRPYSYRYKSSASYSYQDSNLYYPNEIYYFKYEPIKWRVLDPEAGLVMCESIIDTQANNDLIYWQDVDDDGGWFFPDNETEFFSTADFTAYANDYESSTIRKWLNSDFYNVAFSSSEQSQIVPTVLDNTSPISNRYDSNPTTDKVFLPSYYDVLNSDYGFSSDDAGSETRMAKGTDYAGAQGLLVSATAPIGYSSWKTRTGGDNSMSVCGVYANGEVTMTKCGTDSISVGIRPAITVDKKKEAELITVEVTSINSETANLNVTVQGNPSKIRFMNSDGDSLTFTPDNPRVVSVTDNGGSYTWNINITLYNLEETYSVYAKFADGWNTEYSTVTLTVSPLDTDVKSVDIVEDYDWVVYQGINTLIVETGVDVLKVQLMKDGNTWTYNSDNAEVEQLGNTKVWKIKMNFSQLGDHTYNIRVRSAKTVFEVAGNLDVTVYAK